MFIIARGIISNGMKLSDKNIAILAIAIIFLTNGGSPVLTKIALREISPEYYTFLRFTIASLFLLPFFLKTKIKFNKDLLILILISLILTLNIIAFAYGIRLTTTTSSALLYVLAPALVAIFSYFLIKERMTNIKVLGIIFGIIGSVIVILLPVIQKGNPFAGDLIGNILILIGVFSTALYVTISKRLHVKFSPIQVTMIFSLTTVFIMLFFSFPQISANPDLVFNLSGITIFAVFYVGAICTAIYYLLNQYAIKHASPLVASTNLFLNPFSTFAWSSFLLGEKLTTFHIAGGVLVLLGTSFIIKSPKLGEINP